MAQNLDKRYLKDAPKANQEKSKRSIQIYKDRRNVPNNIVQKAVMALYLPLACGRVGKRGKPSKAEEIYADFVSEYQYDRNYPTSCQELAIHRQTEKPVG